MTGQRRRTRSGAELKRLETFYCVYGKHYVIPLEFERIPDNKGICSECAFAVFGLLRKMMYIKELGPMEEMRARKEWESARGQSRSVEHFKQGSDDPGWVYYIAQDDLIKIGYAKNVTRRMKAYGPTAKLLAVHPGTLALEKDMHAKFRSSLDSGREWFRRDDELMAHITDVRERFGDPRVFEYQYTRPKTEEEKVRAMFATREFPSIANGAHSAR